MNHPLSWQYDEFETVGRDYGKTTEVEIYDSSHADFRDLEAESNRVLDILTIKSKNQQSGVLGIYLCHSTRNP